MKERDVLVGGKLFSSSMILFEILVHEQPAFSANYDEILSSFTALECPLPSPGFLLQYHQLHYNLNTTTCTRANTRNGLGILKPGGGPRPWRVM